MDPHSQWTKRMSTAKSMSSHTLQTSCSQTQSPAKHRPARAHHRQRAKARRDRQAITKRSDRAEDRPGARASYSRIIHHTTSDQVREPATKPATEDDTVECEDAEESPTHCSTADGELRQDSKELIDFYSNIPSLLPSSSEMFTYPVLTKEAVYELPVCPVMTTEICVELSVHPELSVSPVTTTEVIPLSTALPVLGVRNLVCVGCIHHP